MISLIAAACKVPLICKHQILIHWCVSFRSTTCVFLSSGRLQTWNALNSWLALSQKSTKKALRTNPNKKAQSVINWTYQRRRRSGSYTWKRWKANHQNQRKDHKMILLFQHVFLFPAVSSSFRSYCSHVAVKPRVTSWMNFWIWHAAIVWLMCQWFKTCAGYLPVQNNRIASWSHKKVRKLATLGKLAPAGFA